MHQGSRAARVRKQFRALRRRLRDAEQTLRALQDGEADALVMSGPTGQQVFTLENADHPYRLFVEQMQEGAVSLGEDEIIRYCNQHFADLLGRPIEQVIGSRMSDYVMPADLLTYQTLRRKGCSGAARGECTLVPAEGQVVPVYLTVSPLLFRDSDQCCMIITDLTEQERSRELIAAKEALESANAAKDRFLAVLSHELRTPLAPIMMTVAALEADSEVPAHLRDDLTMIRRNVELEATLIDDLLDMSRIISGKLTLRPEPLDLHHLLRHVVDICRADLQARDLQVRWDLKADTDRLNGDAARLHQVFWNLLKNAIKFSRPGGHLDLSSQLHGQGQIVVQVRDHGIGIDPELLPSIFSPFYQADESITRTYGGLGLGLTIAKAIIDAHGGHISAESAGPGHGSTFTVRLPLAAAAEIAPSADAEHAPGSDGQPVKVLLVEDHADTARAMQRLLSRSGYSVKIAASAESALSLLARERYDLMISDIGLPDATGYDLMTQARETYGIAGIALSGYGMESDVQRSHAAGFAQHLVKPVTPKRLQESIRSVLGERNDLNNGRRSAAQ
jgi:PAS domain S-box-containing protein